MELEWIEHPNGDWELFEHIGEYRIPKAMICSTSANKNLFIGTVFMRGPTDYPLIFTDGYTPEEIKNIIKTTVALRG